MTKPLNHESANLKKNGNMQNNTTMKKATSVIFAALFSLCTYAQTQLGATESAKLENELRQETMSMNSLQSKFTQTKHVSGMTRDLTSKGDFYYKKDKKVRFEYTTPLKYEMVVNGDKLKVGNQVISAKSGMKELLAMVEACMIGDMEPMKQHYNIKYYKNNNSYLVQFEPKKKNNYVEKIEMTMNISDKMVTEVKLIEPEKDGKTGNDFTTYKFGETKKNVAISDYLFDIK